VIDTSDLNPDTVLAVALARVRARLFMTQENAHENAQDKGGSSLENPGNPRP
jgi:hypothetical protein